MLEFIQYHAQVMHVEYHAYLEIQGMNFEENSVSVLSVYESYVRGL